MLRRVRAILLRRCPRCLHGPVFRRFVFIRSECPDCQLVFQREPGYFTGAMYASYGLGIAISTPIWMTMVFTGQPLLLILGVTTVLLAVLTPVLFVYSRVIWLHLDHSFNPA